MSELARDYESRNAALDPSCSLLVQAPAGSGKTELLTDRILALLPTVQRPEEIVAITFTRKAAAEMHARVMEKLAAAELPPPEPAHARASWELARKALEHDRQQGWQLLQFPARLAIQTIDAFCSGLTRRMPYLSHLGGAPRVADDPGELYAQAARATLDLADDPDYGAPVRTLLEHLDVNPGIAASLLGAMLASRDQWLGFLHRGGDRATLERDLHRAVCHEMERVRQAMPLGWRHELPALARAAQQALAAGGNDVLDALAEWADGEALLAEPEALPQWRALAMLLLTKDGGPRKALNKNQGFPPGCAHKQPMLDWLAGAAAQSGWADQLAQTIELPDPCYSESQWAALTALFSSLRLAAAQLQLIFMQSGEVDFTEITQRALQALGDSDDPSELLLRMDARIRHLLIDEFQDTSQPQIDLLERLTAGWQHGDGRTLFLVGDPMQSIYRFRKAEVGLFLRAAEHGIGEVTLRTLALTDNFRSQAGIVQWVNQRFSALFPKSHDADQSAIAYAPSHAFKPGLEGAAVQFHPVWRLDQAGDDTARQSAAAAHDTEDDIVVRLVREAIAGNTGDDTDRNVAVLVRARSHARALARRLSQEGIAHRAVELTGLAQRPVVADLTQLARALAHPADRLAWLCTLRAPWCGLRLETLATLVGDDHLAPVPTLLAENAGRITDVHEAARLAHVAPILLDDGNASGTLPFAAWVEHIWRRLGGAKAYPTRRDAADAESFFCLLETLSPYAAPDPARLSQALERLYASADPAPEGRNVQIMTMHKSKGLQFDTVILPCLHARGRSDTAPLLRFEQTRGRLLAGPIKPQAEADADPISRFLGRRDARRAAFELDRLLYVAATRAKERLHLVGELCIDARTGDVRPPSGASLLGRLWPVLGDMVPAQPDTTVQDAPAASEQPRRDEAVRLRRLPLSALQDESPRLPQTPAPADMRVDAAAPSLLQGSHTLERVTGEIAHAWLEHIALDQPAGWDAARIDASSGQILTQLSRRGLPQADCLAGCDIIVQTLSATLQDARGRALLTRAAQREWRLLDARGRQLIVDLAFELEGEWMVVDFKTGMAHPDETRAAFEARMRRTYAAQLQSYCDAVAAATTRPARAALYLPRMGMWLDFAFDSA